MAWVTLNDCLSTVSIAKGGTGANSASGARDRLGLQVFTVGRSDGGVLVNGSNGVTEVGRYLDFHLLNSNSTDYDGRLEFEGNSFKLSKPLQIGSGGTGATTAAAARTNIGVFSGSKVIKTASSGTSQCLFTIAEFTALTGAASAAGHFVGVANGDSDGTGAHFDGCTYVAGTGWYVTFSASIGANKSIRINYLIVLCG